MPNPQPKRSPEELWHYLDYCDESGYLKPRTDNRTPNIYRRSECIVIDGYSYSIPRLSYYMHHGYMPNYILKSNPITYRIETLTGSDTHPNSKPSADRSQRKQSTLQERQQQAYDNLPEREKKRIDKVRRTVRNNTHHSLITAEQERQRVHERLSRRRKT